MSRFDSLHSIESLMNIEMRSNILNTISYFLFCLFSMSLFHKILSSQVYSEDPDHIAPAANRSCIQHSLGIMSDKAFFSTQY